jgi:hypothetical protein
MPQRHASSVSVYDSLCIAAQDTTDLYIWCSSVITGACCWWLGRDCSMLTLSVPACVWAGLVAQRFVLCAGAFCLLVPHPLELCIALSSTHPFFLPTCLSL